MARLLDRLGSLGLEQVLEATFDPTTGVPTHVLIDPSRDGIDGEECYDLTDFVPHS